MPWFLEIKRGLSEVHWPKDPLGSSRLWPFKAARGLLRLRSQQLNSPLGAEAGFFGAAEGSPPKNVGGSANYCGGERRPGRAVTSRF